MTFEQSIATQPQWVQMWLIWLGVVVFLGPFLLLFSKPTRRDAVVLFLTNLAIYAAMMWLFQQVGFVRLLGIVHIIFWTPAAVYLWVRLKSRAITFPFRQIMWLILTTIIVSLAFDYADVIRYFLGETASMIR